MTTLHLFALGFVCIAATIPWLCTVVRMAQREQRTPRGWDRTE